MADNEKSKLYYAPRRSTQQNRPTPGVQKAIQTFGVKDLREILNKKREQGESPVDKRPDPKLVKLPPPDPSYNYLKDPTRDKPAPQKRPDNERQFERPIPKDRATNSQQHRYRDVKTHHRDIDQETVQVEAKVYNNREHKHQERGALKKNQNLLPSEGGGPRKELRFADVEEEQGQFIRGGRRGFKSRNARRGSGMPRKDREEKIENPFNIKIQLSTETGLRNCTLDESTKIADIKHVPDNQRPLRGSFRGSWGGFRSRGRGRGRGAFSYRGKSSEFKLENQDRDRFNMEKLKESLPDGAEKDRVQSVENGNIKPDTSSIRENNQGSDNQHEDTPEDFEENLEHYEEYEQDNDEYNDANENYDDEFSNEYFSEYHGDSAELTQNLDKSGNYENFPESETHDHGGLDVTDPNLKGTITITSSKFQDGEVKRSIEAVEKNNGTEKQ